MPPPARISILLADDHTIVREGFRKLLELETDLEVVGEAENGHQTVQMAAKFRPAVVLMDIGMPLLNGIEATRQVLKAVPTTRVLILSAHSDDAYVRSATEAGALGFLLKQTSAHEVCTAIREVNKGKPYLTHSLSRHLSRQASTQLDRSGRTNPKPSTLTSRQREVLQLIAEGKANKETAAILGIGIKTVEKHREHLMAKLDIHDTASLTRYAMTSGIIESSGPISLA
jgi:DNA-binding NarL/FixJ family response regulator